MNAAFQQPLRDARVFGLTGRNHYAHAMNPPYWAPAKGAIDRLLVREGVGERLCKVDQRLSPAGLRLFLFDAWRPRAVQAYFHDEWVPAELRRRMPNMSEDEIKAEVSRYWAAPTVDSSAPAPHETGGAVDLTIAFADGGQMFMGSMFDDVAEISAVDWFERTELGFSFSAEEARANRRMLYWLMIEAGFASHPNEWWHYSYGDQMWAARTDQPAALYGLAAPEPDA